MVSGRLSLFMGESVPDPKAETRILERQGQRVSCPNCGQFLLRIVAMDKGTNLSQEQNCKKCHARVGVTLTAGKVTVSIL